MLIYLIRTALFLALALPLGAAFAQAPVDTSAGAVIGETELKKILLRYQNISELNVDFQQLKTLKEMKQPIRSKGHLTVRPPQSVVYKITSPSKLTVIMDAKTITIESGAGVETTTQILKTDALKGSKEHRHMQIMVSWLQMDPHELATHYKITKTADSRYHFSPLVADDAPFTSLDMTVSKAGDVTTLVMNESSGDTITFLFGTPKITHAKKK